MLRFPLFRLLVPRHFVTNFLLTSFSVGLFGGASVVPAVCCAAEASKTANTSATKIEADEISCGGNQGQKNQERCIATGHARVERDGIKTTAHQITAYQVISPEKKRQITKVLAQGHVTLLMKEGKATSDQAEFTVASETLELRGRLSKLMTAEDKLTATQWIRYHRRDNWAEALGNVYCQTPQGTLYAEGVKAFFDQLSSDKTGAGKTGSQSLSHKASPTQGAQQGSLTQGVKVRKLEAFRNVVVKTPKEFARGDYMRYDGDLGTLTIGKLPPSMTSPSSPSQTSDRCQMLFTPDSSEKTSSLQGPKEMPDA